MTQYEIIEQTPTGLKVALYHQGRELLIQNVPANHCQTISLLETFLRRIAARETKKFSIPEDVLNHKGRHPL